MKDLELVGHSLVKFVLFPSGGLNQSDEPVQYYNYLNKEPQKLHCFYTKISTFVHSTEGVEAIPCYGQRVSQIYKITGLILIKIE